MKNEELLKIFKDTDYVHWSGSKEELQVAEYLKSCCEKMGVEAYLEPFRVSAADQITATLTADGEEIPCEPFYCCGSGEVTGELYYMPSADPVSLAGAKGKIVLIDSPGIGHFSYLDVVKAGAKAILFQYGNLFYDNNDIDKRDLRAVVVGDSKKLLCATINVHEGVKLVRDGIKEITLKIDQHETEVNSHNVIAEIPGRNDKWITLTAHYDTTSLSHGSYDNMSGCVGLLGVMEALKDANLNYGLRFIFCGSEERGLLGSKAYCRYHEKELDDIVLNINLDMIGTILGFFYSCVTAEDALKHYIEYMAAEVNFPLKAKTGVYSSDSSSFADKGVPALSFARLTHAAAAPIHCRYDTIDLLSMDQMQKDIDFITEFTRRMADCVVCPVKKEIPEKLQTELSEYFSRKKAD